ncbi:restriction endonuclease [Aquidulcibacter paucihalophilus]|uniref:restriction endonuclease n=1 Tax=Aquidulcibacter paucihalophilus TaxID=1978549 RepID=UPI000A18D8D3|nr:restriction endonuclease [Aquidulcibacter paucihalophilus]
MGHIIMPAFSFRAALSEDVGTRSGFALTEFDLLSHLDRESDIAKQLSCEGVLRLSSEIYADTVGDLLFTLGAAKIKGMPTLGIRFMSTIGDDWQDLLTIEELLRIEAVANEYLRRRNRESGAQNEVYIELRTLLGSKRLHLWEALQEAMALELAHSPFYTRKIDNADAVALSELFKSEKLPSEDSRFFDQRFINYLAAHPDKIDRMHWRQFEGMTAEWFQRQGYSVELGPGRNDGGIDIRLWNPSIPVGGPPTIIVQCKRQKGKISKVVVKALYADHLHEKSQAGLVVTTSDLTPGAAKDVAARAYPITTANRQEVRRWIEAMRIPNAGIVLNFDIPAPAK